MQYSNTGYILLGAIIEKVFGRELLRLYPQTRLPSFGNDRNADFHEADLDTPNHATGYTNFQDMGDDDFKFQLGTTAEHFALQRGQATPQGRRVFDRRRLAAFQHRLTRAQTARREVA